MLAEYGTLSLEEVLTPAIEMAEGYPIEEAAVRVRSTGIQVNRAGNPEVAAIHQGVPAT